ncbi:hypothetical protein ACKRZS_005192 [Fusarium odoratissimum]
MKNTGGTTWRGTLIDIVTGKSDVIGEWILPSSAGKMLNEQVGFFDQIFFGNPTSKTKGASGGKDTLIYEAGKCVKKLNLKATQTGKGYQIQAGFK